MKEFDLIRLLVSNVPTNRAVRVGPGDDCAVLDLGVPEKEFLFKTDAVVEGIHFVREAGAEAIGRKALARCLSDIAAMAGTPIAALVTLAMPENCAPSFIEAIYAGMELLAKQHDVAIAGGETVRNPERLILSISLLGSVSRGQAVLRSGAGEGDAIFVTGELGGSIDGHHLSFEPRLEEARWLAENFRPSAMLDLSDGLAGDLRHLLAPGRLGAEILASALPIRKAARIRSKEGRTDKSPLIAALTDGEDYELLFTQKPGKAVALLDRWKEVFPRTPLSCVGKIRKASGLLIRDKSGVRELKDYGYDHFAKS
ncbi:MAG: thiamine-monophosphate kinase [Verrucomicrobia bacterium]|nr:thiamine-monophosphate kinase [Verrucomicrobiota bacterium]